MLLCSCGKNDTKQDKDTTLLINSMYYYFKQDVNDILNLISGKLDDNRTEIKVKVQSINTLISVMFSNFDSLSDQADITSENIELSKEHITAIAEKINEQISDLYNNNFSSNLTLQYNKSIIATIRTIFERRYEVLDPILSGDISDDERILRNVVDEVCEMYQVTEYIKFSDNNAPVLADYSDFGFSNIYDKELMNTWVQVEKTFFDNPNDAYFVVETDYATMSFENNTVIQEHWNRTRENKGVFYSKDHNLDGYMWHTNQYSFVNNNILNLYNYRGGATLQIVNKKKYGKVPMVECKFVTDYTEDTSDGKYIPAFFIDWSRSPVAGTYTVVDYKGSSYERECVKYYITPSYFD